MTFPTTCALFPADELRDWLEASEKAPEGRHQVRIPVVIQYEDDYRLAFSATFVGTDVSEPALRLELEDGTMGVSLEEQFRALCPKDRLWCAIWLEGYWGFVVPVDDSEGDPFSIMRVAGRVEPGDEIVATSLGVARAKRPSRMGQ